MTNTQNTQQSDTPRHHPYGLDMATACGHVIPDHHRTAWHDGESFYCSLKCMSAALVGKRQSAPAAIARSSFSGQFLARALKENIIPRVEGPR